MSHYMGTSQHAAHAHGLCGSKHQVTSSNAYVRTREKFNRMVPRTVQDIVSNAETVETSPKEEPTGSGRLSYAVLAWATYLYVCIPSDGASSNCLLVCVSCSFGCPKVYQGNR